MSRSDLDLDLFKAKLLEYQQELLRLSKISSKSRAPVELDQTTQGRLSRQDALQQQEMAKETERRRVIEQQKVEQALKRIENGDYGYCMSCDEEIAEARLKLDPAIAICIHCAE